MKNKFYSVSLIILFQIVQTTTGNAQEWSFGGEIGATLFSFFQYTPVKQKGASFERGYTIPHNEGWLLSYYPAHKNIFFSLAYTRFHPSDAHVLIRLDNGIPYRQVAYSPTDNTVSLNMGFKVDIGDGVGLNRERLFFEPLYGFGLQLLRREYPNPTGLEEIVRGDFTNKEGINPSLQTGFRLSYRYKRSKFSIKALGNLGLRYHSDIQFQVLLPEETILTNVRSKSSFIAAQASYEYIFKSNKVEKRNRKKQPTNDKENTFSNKINELKIAIHPTQFSKRLSISYEQFLVHKGKSLFIDLTYQPVGYGLFVNVSEDRNNPIYDHRKYNEPHLDFRLGQYLYSEKETAKNWGVGHYLRVESRLARSQKLRNDFQQEFGTMRESIFSYFLGIGASLQYKWLIKDRIVISPMVLTDLGIGSEDMHITKYPLFFRPAYFDAQARIYIGYRF